MCEHTVPGCWSLETNKLQFERIQCHCSDNKLGRSTNGTFFSTRTSQLSCIGQIGYSASCHVTHVVGL